MSETFSRRFARNRIYVAAIDQWKRFEESKIRSIPEVSELQRQREIRMRVPRAPSLVFSRFLF